MRVSNNYTNLYCPKAFDKPIDQNFIEKVGLLLMIKLERSTFWIMGWFKKEKKNNCIYIVALDILGLVAGNKCHWW